MTKKRIVVMGAGGQAREILCLIQDLNRAEECYEFIGFAISDFAASGPNDSIKEIVGNYEWLDKNRSKIDAVTIGIGTPGIRIKVASALKNLLPHAEFPALIHPTAILDRSTARIDEGVLVCAGVVATVNVSLKAFCLCNFGCTIGHEATIGRGSVINPGANVNGGVNVGDEVLIGSGAQILQYLTIGDRARVGAGAVVTKNVPPDVTVVGIPARVRNS